jgi:hypothetical protein
MHQASWISVAHSCMQMRGAGGRQGGRQAGTGEALQQQGRREQDPQGENIPPLSSSGLLGEDIRHFGGNLLSLLSVLAKGPAREFPSLLLLPHK